jgi:hypothetical protein
MAPRPTVVRSTRVPWYRTAAGRVFGAVGVVLIIAVGGALIASAVGAGNRTERRRERLDDFTSQVEALSQEVSGPAGQMGTIGPTASKDVLEALEKEPGKWVSALTTTEQSTRRLRPPVGAEETAALFAEANRPSLTAARTFQLVSETAGHTQQELLLRGTEVRDRASSVWSTGTALLDKQRAELDLGTSGLVPPGAGGGIPQG